jgi:spore maturation protein CgeB
MKSLKILYLGSNVNGSTSLHRAIALTRLGHDVRHVNPLGWLPRNRILTSFNVRTGYRIVAPLCTAYVLKKLKNTKFEIAWIDHGGEVEPNLYKKLKNGKTRIVNYNVDDPFGPRDGRKWDTYRKGVYLHDITVVVRRENIEEAKARGAKRVVHVFRSYDPVAHNPDKISESESHRLRSKVLFIGTHMPERGPFLEELIQRGVPLTIRGAGWQRAKSSLVRRAWIGGPLYNEEYVASIKGADLCLGLLSKGNRDLHTQRSAEIPYIGSVFCCERTEDHLEMFTESGSVAMWSSAKECADVCHDLLSAPDKRRTMARLAKLRIEKIGLSNDAVMAKILENAKTI